MTDLQGRIDDLRRQLQRLPSEPDAEAVARLERQARALLSDAKNTPQESAAQSLFAELARMNNPTSPTAATVRGLLRRARIRIEIAGDNDDIDEAIDILAEALALNPRDEDVISLLQEAAARSEQAAQRVTDLFTRHNVKQPATQPPPTAPDRTLATSTSERAVVYPTSSGYPAPESEIRQDLPGRRLPGQGPMYGGADIDDILSELTQAYYSGDYQQTIDFANRVLAQQPGNPTALEYRQKAEDNLIRGVVPDHRIPFDARVSYNRANSLVRAGNYDEAERLYREARDLAERSGILSWKDAEQALLDIQDLALARELINEGDRFMAADNWSEALRKYEGSLRVVANDPQAEERIDTLRRVQQDADQAAVQLNMLSGSLADQAAQLQGVLGILTRLRHKLPNSQRLAQLLADANNRLNGIKVQISDQVQAALARAGSATSLEERLELTNQALHLLELGVELDPSDGKMSDLLLQSRAATSDMQRARQVIERAAALVLQNFDSELAQARSMLIGLRDFAQDSRYRTVVNDLMTRYLERAEEALDDGNTAEAELWYQTLREEPFNILGRRAELGRVEQEVRRLRRRRRSYIVTFIVIIIIIGGIAALLTRPQWQPVLFPPPTATPTYTPTPSETPTPSDTPTASNTPLPSETPTWTPTPSDTYTPSPTVTPSYTVTASLTPTATNTPTHTPTITPTFTPSETPSVTPSPTITPTQPILCRVIVSDVEAVNVRTQPTVNAPRIGTIPQRVGMDVLRQERGPTDGRVWYFVTASFEGAEIRGWVRADTVSADGTQCPNLP